MLRRRKYFLSLFLISILIFVVGCSGGKEEAEETAASDDSNEATSSYPEREIVLTVPFSAGGTNDLVARIFAKHLSNHIGENVIVENKPGGGGLLQTLNLRKEPNDGYHIQFSAEDPFTVQYAISDDVEYELDEYDFLAAPLSTRSVLVTLEDSGLDSIDAIVEEAKNRDKPLTFAHGGIGSFNHFAGEVLFYELGIEVQQVPFGGGGEQLNALLSGDVDLLVTGEATILGQLEEGGINVIANFSNERSQYLEDVPTLIELGYDVNITAMFFVYGPAGMPEDVKATLIDAIKAVQNDSDFIEEIEALGLSIEIGMDENDILKYIELTRDVFSSIDIDTEE